MAQGNTVIVPGLSEAEDVPRGHSEKRIVNDQAMFRHQKETATTLSEQHGQSRLIRRVVQGGARGADSGVAAPVGVARSRRIAFLAPAHRRHNQHQPPAKKSPLGGLSGSVQSFARDRLRSTGSRRRQGSSGTRLGSSAGCRAITREAEGRPRASLLSRHDGVIHRSGLALFGKYRQKASSSSTPHLTAGVSSQGGKQCLDMIKVMT